MADTFTPGLRLQQMTVDGDNNTWGSILDTDLSLIDAAITGVATVDLTGLTSYTLTAANGQPDQARNPVILFTGALTAACYVVIPASVRVFRAHNGTTGGFAVIVLAAASPATEVVLPSGSATALLYCDGTNVSIFGFLGNTFQANSLDAGGAQFRAVNGNYGTMIRNDGTSTYLLVTAAGTPYGSYNGLRPFAFNNASGVLALDGTGAGTYMGGAAFVEGPLTVAGNGGSFYSSFANPGFNYSPLGLLTQRGFLVTGAGGVATVTFPIPFNVVLNIQATVDAVAFGASANAQYVSTAQCLVRSFIVQNTAVFPDPPNYTMAPLNATVWWRAEGY